jgi:hypothetical protein
MVKGYCFLIKFATTDLLPVIVKLILLDVPVAPPVHFSKTYSAAGMAEIVATLPDSYCSLVGETEPPSAGLTVEVNVNITGSSISLVQEIRIIIQNIKKIFFILLKVNQFRTHRILKNKKPLKKRGFKGGPTCP